MMSTMSVMEQQRSLDDRIGQMEGILELRTQKNAGIREHGSFIPSFSFEERGKTSKQSEDVGNEENTFSLAIAGLKPKEEPEDVSSQRSIESMISEMLAPLTPLLSPLNLKKEVISNVNLEPMQEETKPEKRKNTEQDSHRNKKLKPSKEPNRVKDNLTPEEPSQRSDNKESSKLRDEGSKLKHRAEKLYKRSSHIPIALQMYIQAGLKFMESASYMEGKRPSDIDKAYTMYRQTAQYFEGIRIKCEEAKDAALTAQCYKCIAANMSRAYVLRNDRVKKLRGELRKIERQSPLPSPNPPASPGGNVNSISPSISPNLQNRTALKPHYIKELEDLLRVFDAWHKAETYGAIEGTESIRTLVQEVRQCLGESGEKNTL